MRNRYSIVVLALCALFIAPVFADDLYIDDAYYWNAGHHAHTTSSPVSQTESGVQNRQNEPVSAAENTSSAQDATKAVDIEYVNVQDTTITVKINR